MATTAEINDMKRADLDALAVEQGIDPAQYKKADDLRAELLASADDADENAPTEDPTSDEAKVQNTTTTSTDRVINDADRAANEAERPETREPQDVSSHPAAFDKYGQPVFGTGDRDQ